jgi:hypothetical protein
MGPSITSTNHLSCFELSKEMKTREICHPPCATNCTPDSSFVRGRDECCFWLYRTQLSLAWSGWHPNGQAWPQASKGQLCRRKQLSHFLLWVPPLVGSFVAPHQRPGLNAPASSASATRPVDLLLAPVGGPTTKSTFLPTLPGLEPRAILRLMNSLLGHFPSVKSLFWRHLRPRP